MTEKYLVQVRDTEPTGGELSISGVQLRSFGVGLLKCVKLHLFLVKHLIMKWGVSSISHLSNQISNSPKSEFACFHKKHSDAEKRIFEKFFWLG